MVSGSWRLWLTDGDSVSIRLHSGYVVIVFSMHGLSETSLRLDAIRFRHFHHPNNILIESTDSNSTIPRNVAHHHVQVHAASAVVGTQ